MDPKVWGPPAWQTFFLFSANYPEKIDYSNKEHIKLMKSTKQFYKSLIHILPCSYCRKSYKIYFKENNIDDYLSGKNKLIEWLYILKDKVNKKLIQQELQSKIKFTKPSPSLKSIIKIYNDINK